MPLMPGAEPFHHQGGEVGVVLSHGFTGSPQSMRPWAEYLAERGFTVSAPLLPGHGTRWQDMQTTGWQDWYAEVDRAVRTLSQRCRQVFLCGLSMGGALVLHAAAQHGTAVDGLVLVNPSVRADQKLIAAVPVLRHLLPSVPGIIRDIAKEDADEVGYQRVGLHALHGLSQLWKVVQAELSQVNQPVLLLHSRVDHVVSPANSALVLERISSVDVTEVWLERSYHVATLDHEAELIFSRSAEFFGRLTRVGTPAATTAAAPVAAPDAAAEAGLTLAADAGAAPAGDTGPVPEAGVDGG
ncbi:carboxylesterase [Wenjunlia vitaminophila]|uniref:Carboxylesterase n=1 Tax=Wenjunlia vitaminophila TaxID=76728 RepID=A0A0T6LVK6_WENVI|nr:alpha/beta fold hydrolase [Wenjunlia vitaminophila]KRV50101.1 carboxylesterase [Wenjunlia vitaminophila]